MTEGSNDEHKPTMPSPSTVARPDETQGARAKRLERLRVAQNFAAVVAGSSAALLIACFVNPTGLYGQASMFLLLSAIGTIAGGGAFYLLTQAIASQER